MEGDMSPHSLVLDISCGKSELVETTDFFVLLIIFVIVNSFLAVGIYYQS